jgi:hypothetical protein
MHCQKENRQSDSEDKNEHDIGGITSGACQWQLDLEIVFVPRKMLDKVKLIP